jgi:hypothetical protein
MGPTGVDFFANKVVKNVGKQIWSCKQIGLSIKEFVLLCSDVLMIDYNV